MALNELIMIKVSVGERELIKIHNHHLLIV